MIRVAVLGAFGRLGGTLAGALQSLGHDVVRLGRQDLDVTRPRDVSSLLGRLKPQIIVNCTAFNAVDAAETDKAAAYSVNAEGPSHLAGTATQLGSLLIHYSTDFVFDGTADQPYTEEALTLPVNVYGASKLAGETEVARTPRHYVLRVESLFGGCETRGRTATIDYMVDKAIAGIPMTTVVDRIVSPSYVPDVVRATLMLLDRQSRYGIYHCVNSGYTTWTHLALEISRQLARTAQIHPVNAADLRSPARRPLFCALSNRKLADVGIDMPSWESAIQRHLERRLGHRGSAVVLSGAQRMNPEPGVTIDGKRQRPIGR